jgi:hypothetical protein
MPSRTAAILTAAAAVGALLVTPATPAQAHPGSPVVTHPVPAAFTLPAGAVCTFEVRVEFPVTDLTRYTWNANGRPVFAIESGTMITDFTNAATGRTVRRDLSGNGYYVHPDAETTILSGTRIVALLGPADSPPNQLLFSGGGFMSVHVTTASGARVRTVIVRSAKEENLCATLS